MILRLACAAMGTRFELVLAGEPGRADEPRLRAAGEEALREIEACDGRWSAFRRDSLLSHLNRSAAAAPVRVDADSFELLRACAEVHAASGGAFDPSVAPLMAALGFRGEPRESLDAARARVGFEHVVLDEQACTVRFAREGLALDLGAIAKGHGLDLAARVLREAGVERALLHGGTSTALALGPPPGAAGWNVAVSDEPAAPVASLAWGALSVSAPAGRVLERDGVTLGHVLDPRRMSGAPGPHDAAASSSARALRHAAVLASDATRADAWSTALVAGASPDGVPADVELLLAAEPADARPPWRHVAPRTGPSRITLPEPAHQDPAR